MLVVIGVNARGEKHFLAIEDGVRESTQSWREVLLGMKQRGFTRPAKLAVGDGALGFWAALSEVFPATRNAALLDAQDREPPELPPEVWPGEGQAGTARDLDGRNEGAGAERAFDDWLERYDDKYPKATACLARDRDELLAFYDFPAAHWTHLRTTNVIESAFATIPTPQLASQGLRHTPDHAVDDLQNGPVRREILASAPRIPTARKVTRESGSTTE